MATRVPELERLAQGTLSLLDETHPEHCTVKIQLYRHGLKLADDEMGFACPGEFPRDDPSGKADAPANAAALLGCRASSCVRLTCFH